MLVPENLPHKSGKKNKKKIAMGFKWSIVTSKIVTGCEGWHSDK